MGSLQHKWLTADPWLSSLGTHGTDLCNEKNTSHEKNTYGGALRRESITADNQGVSEDFGSLACGCANPWLPHQNEDLSHKSSTLSHKKTPPRLVCIALWLRCRCKLVYSQSSWFCFSPARAHRAEITAGRMTEGSKSSLVSVCEVLFEFHYCKHFLLSQTVSGWVETWVRPPLRQAVNMKEQDQTVFSYAGQI